MLQKDEGLLSEPKLERNLSLREWQWVYLKQESAFLSERYKKAHGKKPGNLIINTEIWQKYIIY